MSTPAPSLTTPYLPLIDGEQLLHSALVEYLDRTGIGWLTSQRILMHTSQPNSVLQAKIDAAATPNEKAELEKAQQFQLPLTNITAHQVSAAANLAKLMMKVTFTTGTAGSPPVNVIWRFISPTALEDRTKWKEVLVRLNKPTAVPAAGSASASSNGPSASPPPSSASAPPPAVVKTEPGLTPPTVPTSSPPISQPSTAPKPTPTLSSAALRPPAPKRPHSAMSGDTAPSTSPVSTPALSGAELQSLIRIRATLLARDPSLQAIHGELVPHAVSEEEFWASRSELIRQEQQKQGITNSQTQRAGISSTMASTIRPETGCNTVKYTLDATQIHAIFLENPMVYELYQQLVPDKLDEKQFWTKYFKSQYIHSQATTAVSTELNKNMSEDDLFAKVARMQEMKENEELSASIGLTPNRSANATSSDSQALAAEQARAEEAKDISTKATLLQRKVDPSVDLTAADMTGAILFADPSKSSGSSAPSSNTTRSKKARAQTELLQKFNRHGMLVLDSTLGQQQAQQRNANTSLAATEQKLQSAYHASLSSSLDLVDLSVEPVPSYNTLSIGELSFASMGARKSGVSMSAETVERIKEAMRAFEHEIDALPGVDSSPSLSSSQASSISPSHFIPRSDVSRSILLDLTSTARGMNKAAIAAKQLREESSQQLIVFSTGDEPDMLIPEQFCEELKKRYHTCNELFRHFWSSLNVRLSAKLHRVHGALDEQHRLLQVIRNNLNSRGFGQLVPLLNPLVNSIETCDATYKKWQEKQQQGPKRMTNVPPTARPPTANNNATVVEPESKRIKV